MAWPVLEHGALCCQASSACALVHRCGAGRAEVAAARAVVVLSPGWFCLLDCGEAVLSWPPGSTRLPCWQQRPPPSPYRPSPLPSPPLLCHFNTPAPTPQVASVPELYPDLLELNVVPSLCNLLSHENTDILADVIELLSELTGAGGHAAHGCSHLKAAAGMQVHSPAAAGGSALMQGSGGAGSIPCKHVCSSAQLPSPCCRCH